MKSLCFACGSTDKVLGPLKFKKNRYYCIKCIFGNLDLKDFHGFFKKGEQYQVIIELAEMEGVPENRISHFVRDLLFEDWPITSNGKKRGFSDVRDNCPEYKGGAFMNRFISWKSTQKRKI